MLYCAVPKLESTSPQVLAAPNGHQVYSLLLSVLRTVNPPLAACLHRGDGPRSFTASLLPSRRPSGRLEEVPDRKPERWLRFTIVDKGKTRAFEKTFVLVY